MEGLILSCGVRECGIGSGEDYLGSMLLLDFLTRWDIQVHVQGQVEAEYPHSFEAYDPRHSALALTWHQLQLLPECRTNLQT